MNAWASYIDQTRRKCAIARYADEYRSNPTMC